MKKRAVLFFVLFLLFGSVAVNAQNAGAWGTTWNNPISSSASVMIQGAINRKRIQQSIANQRSRRASSAASAVPPRSSSESAAAKYGVLQFKPVANSGVAKHIAYALSEDPEQRAELIKIFQAIQRSYEAEAGKGGQSNNIAAALAFFMAASSMAYHQTGEPAESVTDALVEILQQEMSAAKDFTSMTDFEKQQMHDWLVVTGGFVLAGYLDGVETNDRKELAEYKQLADEFFKLVLGTSVEKFNLAGISATSSVDTAATEPENSPPASSAAAMHAGELVREFETNEVRANQLYVGKRVRIYGTVNSIEARAGGNIVLTFNTSAATYKNATCYFLGSQRARVAALNANEEVTVEGTVRGLGGGAFGVKAFLILENCSVP